MGDHHGRDPRLAGGAEGHEIRVPHVVEGAVDDRKAHVGVDGGVRLSGEVLRRGGDARTLESQYLRHAQPADPSRVDSEGAHSHRGVVDVVGQVDGGGEVPVDPQSPHLAAQDRRDLLREHLRVGRSEGHRARALGESLPQTGHDAPLLVDRDEDRARGGLVAYTGQLRDLLRVVDVTGEEDHAADAPALQPAEDVVRRLQTVKPCHEHLPNFSLRG